MSQDEWYRRRTWTNGDREAFFARLKRSRSVFHKSQYVRIQAHTLAEHGHHRDALELLDTLINEYPDRSQLAQAYLQRAECHAALGNADAAIENYVKVFEVEQDYPTVQTHAWLTYPWFIVESGREDLYSHALETIRNHEDKRALTFPIDVYRWAGVKAILAEALGHHDMARDFAAEAIDASKQESSGFRYHPDVGLVSDIGSRIHEQLVAINGVSTR
jgi:tetratricopeptide (TPR) repeat protein